MRAFLGSIICVTIAFSALLDADAQVRVSGYFRSNGTYVQPHYRSAPDGNFSNNWSTKGNINPYTGKLGTRVTPPGFVAPSASTSMFTRRDESSVGPHSSASPVGSFGTTKSAFGNTFSNAPFTNRPAGTSAGFGSVPRFDPKLPKIGPGVRFKSSATPLPILHSYSAVKNMELRQVAGHAQPSWSAAIALVPAASFVRSNLQHSVEGSFGPTYTSARIEKPKRTLAAILPPVTRTWTSSDHRHTTYAEFRGKIEQIVRLRKLDGSIVNVHWDRLSNDDQVWIIERSHAQI